MPSSIPAGDRGNVILSVVGTAVVGRTHARENASHRGRQGAVPGAEGDRTRTDSEEHPPMTTVAAYAAPAAKAPLERTAIERRPVGEFDGLIDIKYAGICHSDIHQV